MLRLALVALLVYLFYKLVKRAFSQKAHPRIESKGVENTMVKDEHCGTYIPLSEALVEEYNGKEYYFCTRECLEAYRKERQKGR